MEARALEGESEFLATKARREHPLPRKPGAWETRMRERMARINAPEGAIDTRDVPEVRDWSTATRGRFYRPIKRQITLRLDADVIDFFERGGKGYQTRMNEALRAWVRQHGG